MPCGSFCHAFDIFYLGVFPGHYNWRYVCEFDENILMVGAWQNYVAGLFDCHNNWKLEGHYQ